MAEKMTGKQALKRLKQETCPATISPDFDKNECVATIADELEALEIVKQIITITAGRLTNDGITADVLFFDASGFVLANSTAGKTIKKIFKVEK